MHQMAWIIQYSLIFKRNFDIGNKALIIGYNHLSTKIEFDVSFMSALFVENLVKFIYL